MKKAAVILTLAIITSFATFANAITYDTSEEIISRIQFEMRHK